MQYFYVCKGKQILKIQEANQITNNYLKKNPHLLYNYS